MSLSAPLSSRQLDILQWIAEGCPPRSWPDHTYKTTALALQNRRLVTVSKKDGWGAVLEPAGLYYLEHQVYPDGHFEARKHRDRAVPGIVQSSVKEPRPRALPPPALVERLLSDTRIEISSPSPSERAAWRRAIHAALGSELIPEGKHLRHTGRDRGPLVIYLDDHPAVADPRRPVPVPATLNSADPIVQLLEEDPSRMGVSDLAQPRALRIMEALATETHRRGYHLALHPDGSCGFQLERHEYTQDYVLDEEWDKVDEYPADEVAGTKYSWQRVSPQPTMVQSGRLILRYDGKWGVRRWADRTRWILEDKLPEILDDFEEKAQAYLDQTRAHEAEEQRLESIWRSARADAHRQFTLAHNRDRVLSQLGDLDRARQFRSYARDLERLVEECSDASTASEIRGWQRFIEAEADRVDPLQHIQHQRWSDPASTDSDLDPFM